MEASTLVMRRESVGIPFGGKMLLRGGVGTEEDEEGCPGERPSCGRTFFVVIEGLDIRKEENRIRRIQRRVDGWQGRFVES